MKKIIVAAALSFLIWTDFAFAQSASSKGRDKTMKAISSKRDDPPLFDAPSAQSKCEPDDTYEQENIRVRRSILVPKEASDTFGRRIGKTYVVLQVTVANRSKDYQYLIHDMSLDLSKLLPTTPGHTNDVYYSLSSRELSLVRGVSEKGQSQDPRNLIFHILKSIGTVAGGITGLTAFEDIFGASVAAYNGPLLSAYGDLLPDYTSTQLNRLNDSAYAANALVPKQQSKVFALFLPQAMFLSKAEQKHFWKEPYELVKQGGRLNLPNIEVCVDGSFITEVTSLAPTITDIFIDLEGQKKFESPSSQIAGEIDGRNFLGADISLTVDSPPGITATVQGTPIQDEVDFQLKTTKPISPETNLKFTLKKGTTSTQHDLKISYTPDDPVITDAKLISHSGTASALYQITGQYFIPFDTQVTVSDIQSQHVTSTVEDSGTQMNITITNLDASKTYSLTLSSKSTGHKSQPKDLPKLPAAP